MIIYTPGLSTRGVTSFMSEENRRSRGVKKTLYLTLLEKKLSPLAVYQLRVRAATPTSCLSCTILRNNPQAGMCCESVCPLRISRLEHVLVFTHVPGYFIHHSQTQKLVFPTGCPSVPYHPFSFECKMVNICHVYIHLESYSRLGCTVCHQVTGHRLKVLMLSPSTFLPTHTVVTLLQY